MNSPLTLALVLALAATGAWPAGAASQQTGPLSLAEALQLARENNPVYRRALAQVGVAHAGERQAVGALLPQLNASIGTSMSQSRVFSGTDNFGQPIKRDDPLIYTGTNSNQGLSLSQTVFDGGANLRRVRAARASGRVADADALATEARIAASVATRYFDVVRARHQIVLEERLLVSAQERLDATQRLLRVGVRNPLDLLGAEVVVAQRELAVEQALGEARKAVLLLAEEIGLRLELDHELTDDLPEVVLTPALDVDGLVAEALARSPDITRSVAAEEAARHQLAVAQAARLPTISLGANLGRSIGGSGYDAFLDMRPLNQSHGFSLGLSVPLFNGFSTASSIAQARAQRLGATEELRAAGLQLEREIRSAAIDLEQAERRLSLTRRSAELSRDRAEMAQQSYALGGLGFSEMQDAVDQAAEAEREALNARLEVVRARITLEEKVGRPVE